MDNTNNKEVYAPEKPESLFKPIGKCADYPVEAFGILSPVIHALHDMTQAPIAFAAQSLLAVASLCVQDIANVQTLGGYSPLALYFLTFGQSGERKSANDKILKKPIDDLQHLLAKNIKQQMQNYQAKSALYKQDYNEIINNYKGKKNDKTAFEADIRALGIAPQEPVEHIITIANPTIEGIFDLLDSGRPSIGLFNDDAGMILGGHSMNKDNRLKTISAFSSFWDGTPANQVRRGSQSKTLYNKRLCMHLFFQPEIGNKLLTDGLSQTQGFLPRMLMTYPTSTIGTRLKHGFSEDSQAIINQVSQKITEHLMRLSECEADNNELNLIDLPLSPEAKAALYEFYDEIEIAQREGGKYYNIMAYASKACEQAARISGVLTLFSDSNAQEVSLEIIHNAIILERYYLDDALRICDNLIIPPALLKAEKLRLWLIDEWKEDYINPRTIRNHAKGNFNTQSEVKQAIQILENHKWLIKSEISQLVNGHKSQETWWINRG